MYPRAKYREDIDWTTIKDPVGSVKKDGAYFNLVIGDTGEPHFISRRESVKGGFPDRSPKLPHLTSTPLPQYAGNVYAAELIHTGHNKDSIESHPAVSGILNSLPPKAIETQRVTGPIRAVLFDVIHPKFNTYGEKLQHLKEVELAFNKPDLIYIPPLKIGVKDINEEIDRTKKSGEEGVIITSLTAHENDNVRVKIKHKNTWNLKVIGITQEFDIHGNPKQSAGALVVADASNREVGNVGTGFTKKMREEIWMNKSKVLGSAIQVIAMESTGTRLRSPVYNGEADGEIDLVPLK